MKCGFMGAVIGALLFAVPALILAKTSGEQAIVERYKGTGNGLDVPVRDMTGDSSIIPTLTILVGVVGALVGVLVGQRKGFELRLQAQMTLCQMQTEFNTRRSS